ncbi:uncharacterized protein LOC62_08G009832 [Vanrija pseudolonga]|uniref:Uncharacterized protein n=1 Tax=Vanrija pseudolonga TaxID=143232 RepID=A0AAF1BUP5_9TREE|nr:hypothetical protein LOC62_08G009832 [Vanrija pseudolonga]
MFFYQGYFARALRHFADEPMASTYRSKLYSLALTRCAVNSLLAYRFWIFFFRAFTTVINFAAAVVRSTGSSLAAAALVHMAQGLALSEFISDGFRSRDDLPVLLRLTEHTRHSLHSVGVRPPRNGPDSDILSFGTKIVRMRGVLDADVAEWASPFPDMALFDVNSTIGALK